MPTASVRLINYTNLLRKQRFISNLNSVVVFCLVWFLRYAKIFVNIDAFYITQLLAVMHTSRRLLQLKQQQQPMTETGAGTRKKFLVNMLKSATYNNYVTSYNSNYIYTTVTYHYKVLLLLKHYAGDWYGSATSTTALKLLRL